MRLDPIEGSEQGGIRPVVIVGRDVINDRSSVVFKSFCFDGLAYRKVAM